MNDPRQVYLGDGVYASYRGPDIELKTEREHGEHFICLEPEVFEALIQFAMKIGWLEKGQVLK